MRRFDGVRIKAARQFSVVARIDAAPYKGGNPAHWVDLVQLPFANRSGVMVSYLTNGSGRKKPEYEEETVVDFRAFGE